MPSPLKKIQEDFVPEGEICNLRITNAFLADAFEPYSLGVEAEIVDGEYAGTPVTDYLNIQESEKNPGEIYISRKGKLRAVLVNALTTREFNALADELAKTEESRAAWIKLAAKALNNAGNPLFRSVIEQNDPEDPANRRNKLTKDPEKIGPYLDPEEAAKVNRERDAILGKQQQVAEAANNAEFDQLPEAPFKSEDEKKKAS